MNSSSRRSHHKARTGCAICKKRKIKCDEQKPACRNCIRHSVECVFQYTQSTTNSPSPAGLSTQGNSPSTRQRAIDATPSSNGGESAFQIPRQPSSLNLLDLELLHNYSTSTCFTLHSEPNMKTLLRINVPQLGFSYDFVMHCILAISALHLAHCTPWKREFYRFQATHHYDKGLRLATSILPDVTDENCAALYIFTVLACFFAIGNSQNTADIDLADEPWISDALMLFRGIRSIIQSSQDALRAGLLGPMFIEGSRRAQLREDLVGEPFEQDEHLTELQRILHLTTVDREALAAYTVAIDELRKSYAVFYNKSTPNLQTDVFIWFFCLTDEYLQLLREHKQESLVILAHYCVIPRALEPSWWIEGWSVHLLSRIYKLLDEEHRLWIRWPIEEIGWVPSQNR